MALKKAVSTASISALLAFAGVAASSVVANGYVVCNHEGDCWHTESRVHVPGVTFSYHPDATGISINAGMVATATIATIMKAAAITKAASESRCRFLSSCAAFQAARKMARALLGPFFAASGHSVAAVYGDNSIKC